MINATASEMIKQIQLGVMPGINEGFHRLLGVPLTPSLMSEISARVHYDYMAGKANWEIDFKYESHWHVFIMAHATDQDEKQVASISQVSMTNLIDGLFKTFKFENDSDYTNPFDWGGSEVTPLARNSGHSAQRENYRRESPYRNPNGRPARTQSHKVEYDHQTQSIRCSCLESSKHTWCKVIMEYVTKSLDVSIVQQYLDFLGKGSGRGMVLGEIRVPVMPRAMLPVKVRRVEALDQPDNAEPVFEYRLEAGAEVMMWHNPGEGLRGIVSEFFAYLNRSPSVAEWKNAVEVDAHFLRVGQPRSFAGVPCPSRHHKKSDEKLFLDMIKERVDLDGTTDDRKNLLYVATLNAFHSTINGKCYGCYVAFNPKEDVPVL